MYNNEVTYDKKWDTKENIELNNKLMLKYGRITRSSSDCPTSWSKEVLELLSTLDAKVGILKNEEDLDLKYFFKKLLISPMSNAFDSVKYVVESPYCDKSFLEKIAYVHKSFFYPLQSAFDHIKAVTYNKLYNKIKNPKIHLLQFKEKFGTLRVYVSCPDYLKGWIDQQIHLTEIKLSIKGAYFSIENLYTWSHTEYVHGQDFKYTNIVAVQEENKETYYKLQRYVYRKLMTDFEKDLKIDLKKIEFDAAKNSEEGI
jgi:hypothetical protein